MRHAVEVNTGTAHRVSAVVSTGALPAEAPPSVPADRDGVVAAQESLFAKLSAALANASEETAQGVAWEHPYLGDLNWARVAADAACPLPRSRAADGRDPCPPSVGRPRHDREHLRPHPARGPRVPPRSLPCAQAPPRRAPDLPQPRARARGGSHATRTSSRASNDHETFSSTIMQQSHTVVFGPSITAMDGEEHDLKRAIIAPEFVGRKLEAFVPVIEKNARELITRFTEKAARNLIDGFAETSERGRPRRPVQHTPARQRDRRDARPAPPRPRPLPPLVPDLPRRPQSGPGAAAEGRRGEPRVPRVPSIRSCRSVSGIPAKTSSRSSAWPKSTVSGSPCTTSRHSRACCSRRAAKPPTRRSRTSGTCLLNHPEQYAEVERDPSLFDRAFTETMRHSGPRRRGTAELAAGEDDARRDHSRGRGRHPLDALGEPRRARLRGSRAVRRLPEGPLLREGDARRLPRRGQGRPSRVRARQALLRRLPDGADRGRPRLAAAPRGYAQRAD